MSTKYTVEVIQDRLVLQRIWQQWEACHSDCPLASAFWMRAWWEVFQARTNPHVLVGRDEEGRLSGMLPLYRFRTLSSGRVLRGMGDLGVCTDYRSLLSEERTEDKLRLAAQFGSVLAEMSSDHVYGWERLVLDGVSQSDDVMLHLLATMQDHGSSIHASSRNHFWRLATTQSWSEYLAGIGRNHRRNLQRYCRRLEQTPGLQICAPTSEEEVVRSTETVIRLHQQRWKAASQQGTFGDPRVIDFIHQVNMAAFGIGRLHLPILSVDGVPLAGEIGFLGGDHFLYLWAMGRSLGQQAEQLSAGKLLTIHTVRRAHESGLVGVDFLRGDEEYKRRYRAVPTPCLQIQVGAPNFSGQVRHAFWRTQFEVAQFIRKQSGRSPILCLPTLHGRGSVIPAASHGSTAF